MLDKLRKGLGGILEAGSKIVGFGKIQELLERKFAAVLDLVLNERKKDTKNSGFTPKDTKSIMEGYIKQNIVLASVTSFIPGPAGLLTSVPGMVASLANQMRCSYDIACAYGKEDMVIKDLLIDIPLEAMGIPTGLHKLQNIKDLKQGAENIISEKLRGLGQVLITKKLKGAMTSLLPGMGTVVAIIQAKLETAKVAATSITFFDPDQILEELVIDDSIAVAEIQEERIKALVNLMTLDSRATTEEINFLAPLIEKSELSESKKEGFSLSLTSAVTDYEVDYGLLKKSGASEDLVVDLAVLTKRDGEIGPRELEYVKTVAKKLNINPIVYEKLFE